jgi:hypothetical protein
MLTLHIDCWADDGCQVSHPPVTGLMHLRSTPRCAPLTTPVGPWVCPRGVRLRQELPVLVPGEEGWQVQHQAAEGVEEGEGTTASGHVHTCATCVGSSMGVPPF